MKGLRYVWSHEQNFRIQTGIGVLVVIAMAVLRVTIAEAIILTMLIMFVLILEVFNTVMEKMVDILKPRIHSYVGILKDMMAAAVLLAAVGSSVVAGMIFIPHLYQIIMDYGFKI